MTNTTGQDTCSYDVLVVGAGIVGAALACTLSRDNPGMRIAVVEAASFRANYTEESFDPRVVALTLASRQLLQSIGAWPATLAQRACAYTTMDVWDGTGTGSIHFDCREAGETALGYIVENSVLVESLLAQLQQAPVTFFCPAKVTAINLPAPGHSPGPAEDKLALVILEQGITLRAPLLIATDGANSPIRHMANLETREWDYGHTAIISTVTTELSHNHCARQRFTGHGPLAFLPLIRSDGKTHTSSIVWSAETAIAQQLLAMDDAAFCTALGQAFEHRLGAILHATPRLAFPLRQKHCKHYFKPGVVVAGDAAHTVHPLAGQGVNLGLQDAATLAGEIHRARVRGIPLSDVSILERYQRRRLGPNLAMMGVMEGFKHLFAQDTLPLRWLRNEGMKQLDRASFIKNRIAREAMGL